MDGYCVNNEGFEELLTVNKLYTIQSISSEQVNVLSDKGMPMVADRNRFKVISGNDIQEVISLSNSEARVLIEYMSSLIDSEKTSNMTLQEKKDFVLNYIKEEEK